MLAKERGKELFAHFRVPGTSGLRRHVILDFLLDRVPDFTAFGSPLVNAASLLGLLLLFQSRPFQTKENRIIWQRKIRQHSS